MNQNINAAPIRRVAFYTLGCKLNFAETATIARMFTENGWKKVPFSADAEVYVINTCSVTAQADRKCRQAIKKASHNGAKVVVIGCYSQLKPEEIAAIEGVDLVLGAKDKFNIIKHLEEQNSGSSQKIFSSKIDFVDEFHQSFSLSDRTRAFLKVQDGCDYHCSYCTIPLARGKSRNPTIAELVGEAKIIAQNKIREIVLTGVNIGDFGRSTNESFIDLLRALDTVEGIYHYRISSIEPNLVNSEVITFVQNSKRFVPHFHIPLQSGTNQILAQMSRRYKRELYAERVSEIKSIMPHACIGADVIVGFPGETEELFNETYNFLRDLDITYLHVFPYSERPNTRAILLDNKIPVKEKEDRVKRLTELSERKRQNFYAQHIGFQTEVLFESKITNGRMTGFTPNYIKIEADADASRVGKLTSVIIKGLLPNGNMEAEFFKES
jgi:threonylcarbamoyladenosine tRNA methylthiotransferase MtaB